MATVQNIIDRAVERSNLNDASLISSTELIAYTSAYEQQVYLLAARGNPDYFGSEGNTSVRGSSTATWSLTTAPGNISAITRVEVAAIVGTVSGISVGDEVNVVSIRNPHFGISPRVYIRNRVAYEYNSELQTDSSNYVSQLKLWYSWLPTTRTATSDALDLPDEFLPLVVLPLSKLLAVRDQRPDEVQAIELEYQMHLGVFISSLGVYDEATIREIKAVSAAAPTPGA